MAKCIRCGKSTLARGHVKLSDGIICTPCFKKLGFKILEAGPAQAYTYDLIKDGKENIERNRAILRARHEQWMEQNPDLAAVFDALETDSDDDEKANEKQED